MKRPIPSQNARIVQILTESVDDNKSVNYVVQPDSRRKSRLRGLMDYCYDVCEAFGEVWISEDEQACGLILHPDKKRISFNSIWWDIKLAISVIGLFRVGQVMGRESKIKKFHPKAPFSYLWFIGVDPCRKTRAREAGCWKKSFSTQSNKGDQSILKRLSIEICPGIANLGSRFSSQLISRTHFIRCAELKAQRI